MTEPEGVAFHDTLTKEETPNCNSGSVSETLEGETNMSSIAETTDNRTIRKPIEQVDEAVIDKLLTDLAAVPEGHYWTLDEGDALYTAPTDIKVILASMVRDPDRERDTGEEFLLSDFYDMNGHRLTLAERPSEWFDQQADIRKPGLDWATENAVHRLGDNYIVVGRGRWYLAGETTVDGERAFEGISTVEYLAREREKRAQERRAFLAANPIIEASQPWWAKEVVVEQGDKLGKILISYSYSIGVDDLYLTQEATLKGGQLTLSEVEVQNGFSMIALDEYATLAGQLHCFADVLDRLAKEAS